MNLPSLENSNSILRKALNQICHQWMVVDYKLFKPGQPLNPGLLWVLEQVSIFILFNCFAILKRSNRFLFSFFLTVLASGRAWTGFYFLFKCFRMIRCLNRFRLLVIKLQKFCNKKSHIRAQEHIWSLTMSSDHNGNVGRKKSGKEIQTTSAHNQSVGTSPFPCSLVMWAFKYSGLLNLHSQMSHTIGSFS